MMGTKLNIRQYSFQTDCRQTLRRKKQPDDDISTCVVIVAGPKKSFSNIYQLDVFFKEKNGYGSTSIADKTGPVTSTCVV